MTIFTIQHRGNFFPEKGVINYRDVPRFCRGGIVPYFKVSPAVHFHLFWKYSNTFAYHVNQERRLIEAGRYNQAKQYKLADRFCRVYNIGHNRRSFTPGRRKADMHYPCAHGVNNEGEQYNGHNQYKPLTAGYHRPEYHEFGNKHT